MILENGWLAHRPFRDLARKLRADADQPGRSGDADYDYGYDEGMRSGMRLAADQIESTILAAEPDEQSSSGGTGDH